MSPSPNHSTKMLLQVQGKLLPKLFNSGAGTISSLDLWNVTCVLDTSFHSKDLAVILLVKLLKGVCYMVPV